MTLPMPSPNGARWPTVSQSQGVNPSISPTPCSHSSPEYDCKPKRTSSSSPDIRGPRSVECSPPCLLRSMRSSPALSTSTKGKHLRFAEPVPTTPTCRNGHPNSPGDLICSVCGEPVEEHDHPTTIAEPMVETEPEPEPESIETIVDGWRLHHRIVASSSVRERFVAVHEADGRRGV